MKIIILLATLFVAVYSAAFDQRLDVLATECDPLKCQPPSCRCSSTQLSPNIEVSKIPQVCRSVFIKIQLNYLKVFFLLIKKDCAFNL